MDESISILDSKTLVKSAKTKDVVCQFNTHFLTTSRPPISGCRSAAARKCCKSFLRESRKAGRKRPNADLGGRDGSTGDREC